MNNLVKIEQEKNVILPKIFKEFYVECSVSIPPNLVGTDLLNNYPDLFQYALDLLTENNVENFLTDKDIVFLMHQGYIFMYFRADGNPDPEVFMYHEIGRLHESKGKLSDVIKVYKN